MEIKYSENSVKQLKKIKRGDRKRAEEILAVIEKYSINPFNKYDLKILKGKLGNFKRLRVGDYRVIFEIKDDTMFIYVIKHRKDVYD